jgi:FkbM family methyltransferase
VDGGAREALSDPRWQVFDPKRVRLYGFEPDDAEVAALNALVREKGLDYHYFSGALWSKPDELTFYENKAPGGGSFYAQNTDLTHRWKFENNQEKFLAKDIFHPTGTAQWKVTSLDAWARAQNAPIDIDFMKLNVQGAELEILQGAESMIDRTIGLMVEISFVESYKGRPFFADLDRYLRSKHFTFFDLIGHHYIGRANSPITVRQLPGLYPLWGQLIEGHGIYLRDVIDMEARGHSLERLTTAKLLKLVAFAEVFGQIEYAFEVLGWMVGLLERRGDASSAAEVQGLAARAEQSYRKYMI